MSITINDREPSMMGLPSGRVVTSGKAWELILPQADAERLVASWVIHAPYAHPMWSNYLLEVVTLRDGLEPPVKHRYLERATHEMHLTVLHPGSVPVLDGRNTEMRPLNFAAQLTLLSDEHARVLLKPAVMDVIEGRLNPDTDFVRMWADRFGDNMMRK